MYQNQHLVINCVSETYCKAFYLSTDVLSFEKMGSTQDVF